MPSLFARQDIDIDVMAVVNDTTGTLMSCAHKNRECRVGVIVGTGTNACYMEEMNNVPLFDPAKEIDPGTFCLLGARFFLISISFSYDSLSKF